MFPNVLHCHHMNGNHLPGVSDRLYDCTYAHIRSRYKSKGVPWIHSSEHKSCPSRKKSFQTTTFKTIKGCSVIMHFSCTSPFQLNAHILLLAVHSHKGTGNNWYVFKITVIWLATSSGEFRRRKWQHCTCMFPKLLLIRDLRVWFISHRPRIRRIWGGSQGILGLELLNPPGQIPPMFWMLTLVR